MNATLPRTITLKAITHPDREPITVRITEETPAFWVGVQVGTRQFPRTVFPRDVWQEVQEQEGDAA